MLLVYEFNLRITILCMARHNIIAVYQPLTSITQSECLPISEHFPLKWRWPIKKINELSGKVILFNSF